MSSSDDYALRGPSHPHEVSRPGRLAGTSDEAQGGRPARRRRRKSHDRGRKAKQKEQPEDQDADAVDQSDVPNQKPSDDDESHGVDYLA
ncbi:MAG: hypothetical protein KGY99_05000 [Phycisphaerae bacterium]|nr:hypothetical protein [Phycisphaerae bacterium]